MIVIDELIRMKSLLETAITALESIGGTHQDNKRVVKAIVDSVPRHWTQTPAGRKRMSEIQRVREDRNGKATRKATSKATSKKAVSV